ncbi:MAG TPA: Holliday junction branch migration protein RuvA [Oscillospiraceae bacterium]|nr:Holliday junction branch migration protein RuvA [Oscillospiraceae bacterium]
MFYYLDGSVAHLGGNLAVIDCGGVGYACLTSLRTLSGLKRGEKARLYTHLYVREDVFDLYGFLTQEELSCFKLLIGVSGVGPKAALSILSSSSPAQLATAIITGDERALTVAPGIGKRIAQRVILELKDKIAKEQPDAAAGLPGAAALPGAGGKPAEAAAALAVLGYSQSDIGIALKGIDMESLPLEEIVRQALKRMLK